MLSNIERTAQLLYKAVSQASIPPAKLGIGDLIIITGATDDAVGIVKDLQETDDQINIVLYTAKGLQQIKVSDKNYIHLIKRADMLSLRKHTDYDRDLKDMTEDTHGYDKGCTQSPEHGPVLDSDKSNLPTSKISLNLRNRIKN